MYFPYCDLAQHDNGTIFAVYSAHDTFIKINITHHFTGTLRTNGLVHVCLCVQKIIFG